MAYNPDIPQAADDPSQSQGQILANFQELNTFLSVNHESLNSGTQGKHKFLQMPEQASAPATAANEGAIYTQESSFTGNTECVFRRESNGSEIEFTGLLGAENGWTRLPSGILLKWGSSNANGSQATNFPTGPTIPVFSAVYTAQVTTFDDTAAPNTMATLQGITTTAITVYGSVRVSNSATNTRYRYLVIGS